MKKFIVIFLVLFLHIRANAKQVHSTPKDTISVVESVTSFDSSSASDKKSKVDSAETAVTRKAAGDLAFENFAISIGANFGFVEGLKAEDVYGELSISFPKMLMVPGLETQAGFFGGVYQNRSFSGRTDSTKQTSTQFTSPTFVNDSTITQSRISSTTRFNFKPESVNLSLYAGIYWAVSKNLQFIFPYYEIQKQDFQPRDVTQSVVRADTTLVTIMANEQGQFQLTAPGAPPSTKEAVPKSSTEFREWIGLGFQINASNKNAAFFLRTIFTRSKLIPDSDDRVWLTILQLRMRHGSTGIRVGAEARLPAWETNIDPSLAVFLAKDFGLSKLSEFLKP